MSTIISAKITQIIRGKSRDVDRDLNSIKLATDRIVKSIRGLREFIYPHEVQEVMELEEMVNEVLALYGQRLINHGVKVRATGLAGKKVNGQRVQLEQVFLSLIKNSVEAVDKLE
jgi:C4-dicarboxylate-specific signal transduction histidine kinase